MITLTDNQARRIRRLAKDLLDAIPDPDSPVHADAMAMLDRPTLCGRGSGRSRRSAVPAEVSCQACLSTMAWGPWSYERLEEIDEGHP